MVVQQQAFATALRSRNYTGLSLKTDVIEGTGHHTAFPIGLTLGMVQLMPGPKPQN